MVMYVCNVYNCEHGQQAQGASVLVLLPSLIELPCESQMHDEHVAAPEGAAALNFRAGCMVAIRAFRWTARQQSAKVS